MKRILVTGAGGSAAANFIASLRKAKEKFFIVGTDVKPYHIELADVDKRYLLPLVTDPEYLTKLNAVIKKEKIAFVHPQPDPEVLFLSRNREQVNAKLLLPSNETIELCQNKIALIDFLKQKNLSVPQSYFLTSQKELNASLNILFKKNKKLWLRAIRGAGSKGSIIITDSKHAEFWIDYWHTMKGLGYGDFMVSEFLSGKEFAFQSIWKEGKLITSHVRERVEYIFGHLTLTGQTSSPSVARTVHRSDINKLCTDAIKKLDPKATGVFCVDLKENSKGIPCIMEINAGRFFTTSNFFTEAGVNMPYYYVKMAFDEKLPSLKKYNAIPKDWYWVRMIDMGYKLIKNKWRSKII